MSAAELFKREGMCQMFGLLLPLLLQDSWQFRRLEDGEAGAGAGLQSIPGYLPR